VKLNVRSEISRTQIPRTRQRNSPGISIHDESLDLRRCIRSDVEGKIDWNNDADVVWLNVKLGPEGYDTRIG
jgi:hypothetical protein